MGFTIVSTLLVVAGVIALWVRAEVDRRELASESERIVKALDGIRKGASDDDLWELVRNVHQTLHRRGMASLEHPDRRLAIGLLRAWADVCRARITASIELMPQLGLLGTVVGLMYTMLVQQDTSVSGIGTALLTTFVGLVGLLAARLLIEPAADKEYRDIVHLLDDPRLLAESDSAGVR